MKNLVFISGEMGAGKTSIVNFFEHAEHHTKYFTSKGQKNNTIVNGWVSPGGKHGLDSIGHKNSKAQFFAETLPSLKDYNVIAHGTFYESRVDIERFAMNHKVFYIILKTSKEEIYRRVEVLRGGSIKEITYNSSLSKNTKLLKDCEIRGLAHIVIDNNRSLEVVANEVWGIINNLK